MIAGWSSNSGYPLLGGLRALAQTISYEVILVFILLSFVVFISRYDILFLFYSTYAGPKGMCVEKLPYAARTHSILSKIFRKDSKFDRYTGYSELTFLNSST
jgi:hypothetical protein